MHLICFLFKKKFTKHVFRLYLTWKNWTLLLNASNPYNILFPPIDDPEVWEISVINARFCGKILQLKLFASRTCIKEWNILSFHQIEPRWTRWVQPAQRRAPEHQTHYLEFFYRQFLQRSVQFVQIGRKILDHKQQIKVKFWEIFEV